MAEVLSKVEQPITALRVSSTVEVEQLFSELREAFDQELDDKRLPNLLEDLRVRWLGRGEKSVRRKVLANWLKVESPVRQSVGKFFQSVLADDGYVAQKLHEQKEKYVAAAFPHDHHHQVFPLQPPYVQRETGSTEAFF